MTRVSALFFWALIVSAAFCADQTTPVQPPAPKAVQTVHRDGVPHTDRKGKRLRRYTARYEGNALTEFPIRTLLKPHPQGGYVLLTVNLDRAVLDGVFKFTRPLGSVRPLFETGELVPIETGALEFSAEHEPFGTRVFRLVLVP